MRTRERGRRQEDKGDLDARHVEAREKAPVMEHQRCEAQTHACLLVWLLGCAIFSQNIEKASHTFVEFFCWLETERRAFAAVALIV